MKATGYVRRIDDTGDIIIPVEVRREYKIKEGDFVEICVVKDDNTIVFQKYSHLEKEKVFLSQCIASANKSAQVKLLVVDKDKIVAGATKYINKDISEEFDDIFSQKTLYCYNGNKVLVHYGDYGDKNYVKYAMPIVVKGSVVGAVVCITDKESPIMEESSKEAAVTKLVASIINKHFEN